MKGRRLARLEAEWGRVSETVLSLGTLGRSSLCVLRAADVEKCGEKYMRRPLCAWFQGALPDGVRSATEPVVERPGDLLFARARSEHQGEEEARLGRSESTRLNSSHTVISYAVFCLKKKKKKKNTTTQQTKQQKRNHSQTNT